MTQRTTILILIGALLVIAIISYSLIATVSRGPATPATTTSTTGTGFDLSILQRSDYKLLDQGPIQSSQLPVQPPSGVGKANPFL